MTSNADLPERAAVVSTGRWIAAARALETERPDRLFNDPWAALLAGEGGRAALAAADYNPFLPVRTRYFDDAITAAAGEGLQIVLLGAGLDTRAFRLPLPGSCVVYEIDYPEAFTGKQAALASAVAACERRSVPVDLSGHWTPELLDAGFDRSLPTVWVAEGLFFYLAADAAGSLVREAATLSARGSCFVADIFGTGLLDLESMAPLVAARTGSGRALPFCTDTPEELFRSGGWSRCEVVYPGQSAANFGRLGRLPDDGEGGQRSTLRTHLVTASV